MSDDWQAHAACAGSNMDLFFPERGESHAAAKAICDGCPVQHECLDYALTHDEVHGIWGGTSERERKRIGYQTTRTLQPINHGTAAGYTAHRRRFEEPCGRCVTAWREHTAHWRDRQRHLKAV